MHVEKSILVSHTQQQMFELVDRCEDYPLFLPWCKKVDLHQRDEQFTTACLHIDFLHIKSNFTTKNIKVSPASMHLQLVDGPFHSLEGRWNFQYLADYACKVEFMLDYTFSNRLLEKTIGPVFAKITSTFVDAFVKRADKIYS